MTNQQTPPRPAPVADDEIDLLALAKTFWKGRRTVIISIISGAILGVAVALLSPVQYTATSVMVPQMGSDPQSKLGGLGGLAALAGIDLSNMQGSSDLSPMIYPQIVSSIPFQLELMNTPLNFKDHTEPVTLFDYYTKYGKTSVLGAIKKYTIGLPGVIIKAIKGKPAELKLPGNSNQPIMLSSDQYRVQKLMDGMLNLDVNAKDGYLTLTANLPEALAAAQLAQKAQDLLQKYITEFKIEKTKANLDFIQGRYNDTKNEFEKAQVKLALISDRNKNFTSGLSQIETDRIQTQYTLTFGVFQELAKQLEQAKIQVKKDTPVFTVVEPVTIPSEKSKPKKVLILIIWIFLGGIIGTGIVFGKEFTRDLKKQWKELN